MAQYSYEQIDELRTNNGNDGPQVGFFNLQNDGQEAIVRFLVDSPADFDILTVHDIMVDGKTRQANCIRDAREDVTKCPLCTAGVKLSNKLYIRMLQYTRDNSGNVTCEAKVWNRSLKYASVLKGYLDNYGPLSDIICKVVRHGARGSMQTSYDIIPNLNKSIYRDDIYVKDTSAFEGYKVLGRVVLDKNFDELADFLSTGAFPKKQSVSDEATPKSQYTYQTPAAPQFEQLTDEDLPFDMGPTTPQTPSQPMTAPQSVHPVQPWATPQAPVSPAPQQAAVNQGAPWAQPTNANRPVRRY